MIKVFKMTESAKLPTKTDGNMCYDVYSDEDKFVRFGKVTVVKTGIKIQPPDNYHYSVRDRSGLAVKEGLHVVAGQIDNIYRGELLICLTKVSRKNIIRRLLSMFFGLNRYKINKGDKIAQIKFEKDESFDVLEVKSEQELSLTVRGDKGFGSSGR